MILKTTSLVLLFLALAARGARPVELPSQSITFPATACVNTSLFIDVDGDGLLDLSAIDPIEKKLLYYHQRSTGFTNTPDQIISLPPQTGWVSGGDVDGHPGLELLISTSNGVLYSRQNAGLFESDRHMFIEASQIFTNHDYPILTSLSSNNAATNVSIPVFSSGKVTLYHRTSPGGWSPGPSLPLEVKQTTCSANIDPWDDPWTLGPHSAHRLSIQQSFRAKPGHEPDKEPGTNPLRGLSAS